jgi:hypothetical protein
VRGYQRGGCRATITAMRFYIESDRRCFIPSNAVGWIYRYQQTRPPEKQYSGRFEKLVGMLRDLLDRW